jgi:hypothetical protein
MNEKLARLDPRRGNCIAPGAIGSPMDTAIITGTTLPVTGGIMWMRYSAMEGEKGREHA